MDGLEQFSTQFSALALHGELADVLPAPLTTAVTSGQKLVL